MKSLQIIYRIAALLYAATVGLAQAGDGAQKTTYVDVMFLYTAGVEREANGDVQTLIDHKVAVTNSIYANSGLDIVIRSVHAKKVTTSDTEKTNAVLNRMTNDRDEFAGIAEERKQHGADMVVMLRPYANDGICGLAWIGGYGARGNMTGYKKFMYSHTSMTSCGDYVMAHEMGHNMGLNHSRRQNPKGGTYSYATGYGVDGQFVTVMAYFSAFSTYSKIYRFSNPSLDCKGVPCGISQGDAINGANAVHALKTTVPQVARYLASNQDSGHDTEALGMTKLFEYRDMAPIPAGGTASTAVDKLIRIPEGASRLLVTTSGGDGDCNLYAHDQDWPSPELFTHSSASKGHNKEKIVINNPGNRYTLSLFPSAEGCRGVTMKAYYQ